MESKQTYNVLHITYSVLLILKSVLVFFTFAPTFFDDRDLIIASL